MSDIRRLAPYSDIDVAVLEPIRWQSWPLVKSPARTAAVLAGIATVGLLVRAVVGDWLLGLLAAAAVLVSLWRFFIPVTYGLSEYGVEQRVYGRCLRIPWRAIRRFEICSAGVLLVPHGERTVMAPFRSLYLPWEGHCDEVLAFMRHFLDAPHPPE